MKIKNIRNSKNKISSDKVKNLKGRILIVGIIFSIGFSIILLKAIYLQIFCKEWLSKKALEQYEHSLVIQGKRGSILDTNYQEMALTVDMKSLACYPMYVKNVSYMAENLSKILKMDINAVTAKLKSKRSFEWIKRRICPKEVHIIEKMKLGGIGFVPEQTRFYPNKTLAAQVIGFTGSDGKGLEGTELYYDKYLKGDDTSFTIMKDAIGRIFSASDNEKMINNAGYNIVMTIDRNIQYIAEVALEEAVTGFSAKSGMAIVMSPKTGAILAMTNYPFFNSNDYKSFPAQSWKNRTLADFFEPGSTMKIFTVSASLEAGVCKPTTTFYCEKGAYKIGRAIVKDTHSYGNLTVQEIIKYSSNIGAIKISEILGARYLYNYLHGYGFGLKTGIDCPGETEGLLAPYKKWSKIGTGTIAFGHGISSSALQLINAASAIANDGILMKPYIVRAITDAKGNVIKEFNSQKIKSVISPQTAKIMKEIMKTVMQEGGTGTKANLDGYTVCGKTGTAQKPNTQGRGYARGKYISSFIGFAPIDNPEITVLVVIDEPSHEYYAGTVAAPAFRKIASETLSYLNIPPDTNGKILTVAKIAEPDNG